MFSFHASTHALGVILYTGIPEQAKITQLLNNFQFCPFYSLYCALRGEITSLFPFSLTEYSWTPAVRGIWLNLSIVCVLGSGHPSFTGIDSCRAFQRLRHHCVSF